MKIRRFRTQGHVILCNAMTMLGAQHKTYLIDLLTTNKYPYRYDII